MARLADWIQAARPKTLGAAIAPVIVGTALAWKLERQLHPWLAVCALLSCSCLQIATNWFNDALDALKGADTAARLGPRRITASGVVGARPVMIAGALMLVLAVALAVPLLFVRGWPILAIGIPSLYFCFGYTGGPYPLAYRGLGELFVLLFFGLVAVTGSTFVQTGEWHREAVIAGIQVGCLSTVLIAINNLRDRAEDSTTGKRTLAVRFGDRFVRWEILLLTLLAYSIGPSLWTLPALLLGLMVVIPIMRGATGGKLNQLLALAGAQLVFFSLLYAMECVRS
jgi:1,4-dihydroxy-2-naphthoate polyprenyltransferase